MDKLQGILEKMFKGTQGARQQSQYPPFWPFDVGETILGQITAIGSSPKTSKAMFTVATDDGRLLNLPMTIAFYSAHSDAMKAYQGDVGVGSIVRATYNGRKTSKKTGRPYLAFNVSFGPVSIANDPEVMEELGLPWKDKAEIKDADVVKAKRRRDKYEEEKKAQEAASKGEGEQEKKEPEPEPKAEPKTPAASKEKAQPAKEVSEEAKKVIEEVTTLVGIFGQGDLDRVESLLKKRGLDVDAETFVEMAGFKVEDGKVVAG